MFSWRYIYDNFKCIYNIPHTIHQFFSLTRQSLPVSQSDIILYQRIYVIRDIRWYFCGSQTSLFTLFLHLLQKDSVSWSRRISAANSGGQISLSILKLALAEIEGKDEEDVPGFRSSLAKKETSDYQYILAWQKLAIANCKYITWVLHVYWFNFKK